MFTYVFARGAARGYLDSSYIGRAKKAFDGMVREFVWTDQKRMLNLNHTCKGAGLGGTPYRDGSYEYYISEPQRLNDLKGLAPFLLAAIQLEQMERRQ
jgi:unsaturated rhamnogalacturonyl hydrolase